MRTRLTWTEFQGLQRTSLWINWRCPFQVLKTSLETLSFHQTAGSAGNNPGQKGPMEIKPPHRMWPGFALHCVTQVRNLKPKFMCCTMQRALQSLAANVPSLLCLHFPLSQTPFKCTPFNKARFTCFFHCAENLMDWNQFSAQRFRRQRGRSLQRTRVAWTEGADLILLQCSVYIIYL